MISIRTILSGSLLVSAVIGTSIVFTDTYLWSAAPTHALGLIGFIALEIALAIAFSNRISLASLLSSPLSCAGDRYARGRTYILNPRRSTKSLQSISREQPSVHGITSRSARDTSHSHRRHKLAIRIQTAPKMDSVESPPQNPTSPLLGIALPESNFRRMQIFQSCTVKTVRRC